MEAWRGGDGKRLEGAELKEDPEQNAVLPRKGACLPTRIHAPGQVYPSDPEGVHRGSPTDPLIPNSPSPHARCTTRWQPGHNWTLLGDRMLRTTFWQVRTRCRLADQPRQVPGGRGYSETGLPLVVLKTPRNEMKIQKRSEFKQNCDPCLNEHLHLHLHTRPATYPPPVP